jgi:hypothetical protein
VCHPQRSPCLRAVGRRTKQVHTELQEKQWHVDFDAASITLESLLESLDAARAALPPMPETPAAQPGMFLGSWKAIHSTIALMCGALGCSARMPIDTYQVTIMRI